jgi:hypothetical protein
MEQFRRKIMDALSLPFGLTSNSNIENSEKTSFFERLSAGIRHVADRIQKFVLSIVWGLAEIKDDPDALSKVIRGAGYLLLGAATLSGISYLPKLNTRLDHAVGLIDFAQVLSDFKFYFSGEFLQSNPLINLGRAAFVVANVGGAFLWLQELGVKCAFIAKTIGQTRVFNFLTKVPLGMIVTGAVGFGFAFFGADAIRRLVKNWNSTEENANVVRRQAWIDLAWCTAEVFGKCLIIGGLTASLPIVALGLVSVGLGLAAFLHSKVYSNQLKSSDKTPEVSQ